MVCDALVRRIDGHLYAELSGALVDLDYLSAWHNETFFDNRYNEDLIFFYPIKLNNLSS